MNKDLESYQDKLENGEGVSLPDFFSSLALSGPIVTTFSILLRSLSKKLKKMQQNLHHQGQNMEENGQVIPELNGHGPRKIPNLYKYVNFVQKGVTPWVREVTEEGCGNFKRLRPDSFSQLPLAKLQHFRTVNMPTVPRGASLDGHPDIAANESLNVVLSDTE